MRTAARVALVAALGLTVVGSGVGSGSAARPAAAALGPAAYPASPSIAADGTLGFDALWTGGAIMTSHYSRSTRTWSPGVALSAIGVGQSTGRIAASPSGAAAAIWTIDSGGSSHRIQASYRPSLTGAWQPAVAIYSRPGAYVASPQLGMDTAGNAYATWSVDGRAIELAEHPAGASGWSAPVAVVRDQLSGLWTSPVLAVSATGTLALGWEHYRRGSLTGSELNRMYVKVRPGGGSSWLPTVDLGPEGFDFGEIDANPYPYGPQIVASPDGNLFVAWQWPRGNAYYPGVAILTAARGGSTPHIVTLPNQSVGPSIAGDDHGLATVLSGTGTGTAETRLSGTAHVLSVRRINRGAAEQVVADGRGDIATVGWGGAAVRRAGRKTWCPRIALSTGEPQIAIAPDGTAAVVWHEASTRPDAPMLARILRPCAGP